MTPRARDVAIEQLLASEARFRSRVARLPDATRVELATALREYSSEIVALDHSKGMAFAELADLVTPAFRRTFS